MGVTLGHDLCPMLLAQQASAFLLTHHVGRCVSAAALPACDACAGVTGATGPAGTFQATGALITSYAASLSICLETHVMNQQADVEATLLSQGSARSLWPSSRTLPRFSPSRLQGATAQPLTNLVRACVLQIPTQPTRPPCGDPAANSPS